MSISKSYEESMRKNICMWIFLCILMILLQSRMIILYFLLIVVQGACCGWAIGGGSQRYETRRTSSRGSYAHRSSLWCRGLSRYDQGLPTYHYPHQFIHSFHSFTKQNVTVFSKKCLKDLSYIHSCVVVQEAKAEGSSVTVETCAHYLAFTAEDIPEGATQYKCAPPIRESHHRELLWKALLVCVQNDHLDFSIFVEWLLCCIQKYSN